jgi:phage terminase large subunit-like protein
LHYLAQRLTDVVWCDPFNQNAMRLESDAQLRTLIIQRGIGHDGSMTTLREHLMNADAKIDDTGHKLRIVKRQSHLKIDAAVALSMAAYRALELNLY